MYPICSVAHSHMAGRRLLYGCPSACVEELSCSTVAVNLSLVERYREWPFRYSWEQWAFYKCEVSIAVKHFRVVRSWERTHASQLSRLWRDCAHVVSKFCCISFFFAQALFAAGFGVLLKRNFQINIQLSVALVPSVSPHIVPSIALQHTPIAVRTARNSPEQ